MRRRTVRRRFCPHTTASELLHDIEAGAAPTILDVRTGWEFRRGRIPGAIHVPFWAMATHVSRLATLRAEPIVVYCGHGPRARLAALALRLGGFLHVRLLEGHYSHWKRAGFSLEAGPMPAASQRPARETGGAHDR